MHTRSLPLVTTILLACGLAALELFAQDAGFYRLVSTSETHIVSFDITGLLTCTGSCSNASFEMQLATAVAGPWTSNLQYTVVANVGSEKAALVPCASSGLPNRADNDSSVLARVQNSVVIGQNTYRIEAFLWQDFMPGPIGPPSGLLANVSLVETLGNAVPASISMTRIWFINGQEVWRVVPWTQRRPAPHILETTARNGPYWTPGTAVDVILEISSGNVSYLLKAANQVIEAVW